MTAPGASTKTSQTRSSTTQSKAAGKAPEPAPAPVMNLLDFDENEPAPAAGSPPATAATNKALPALAPLVTNENSVSLAIISLYIRSANIHAIASADDDFTDFQAAPSSPPAAAPVVGTAKPNLMDLLASTAPSASRSIQSAQPKPFGTLNTALSATSSQQLRPSSTPATAPGYTTGIPVMNPMAARSPMTASTTSSASASASTKTGSAGGGFDDLWSMSLGSAVAGKSAGGAKSIRDLEKEKAQAGIWGAQSQMRPHAHGSSATAAAGAFGSFVKPVAPSSGGESTGADDLLL
jgi:epsin